MQLYIYINNFYNNNNKLISELECIAIVYNVGPINFNNNIVCNNCVIIKNN